MSTRHNKWSTTEPFDVAVRFERVLNVGMQHLMITEKSGAAPIGMRAPGSARLIQSTSPRLNSIESQLAYNIARIKLNAENEEKVLNEWNKIELGYMELEYKAANNANPDSEEANELQQQADEAYHKFLYDKFKAEIVDRQTRALGAARQQANTYKKLALKEENPFKARTVTTTPRTDQRDGNVQESKSARDVFIGDILGTIDTAAQEEMFELLDAGGMNAINEAMKIEVSNVRSHEGTKAANTTFRVQGMDVAGYGVRNALAKFEIDTSMSSWKKKQLEMILFIAMRLKKFRVELELNAKQSKVRLQTTSGAVMAARFGPFRLDMTMSLYVGGRVNPVTGFSVDISYDVANDAAITLFNNVKTRLLKRFNNKLSLRSYISVAELMQEAAMSFKENDLTLQ